MSDDGPLLLTKDQALSVLGVDQHTLDRLVKAGEIRSIRVGRRNHFRRSDLEAWVDAQFPDITWEVG